MVCKSIVILDTQTTYNFWHIIGVKNLLLYTQSVRFWFRPLFWQKLWQRVSQSQNLNLDKDLHINKTKTYWKRKLPGQFCVLQALEKKYKFEHFPPYFSSTVLDLDLTWVPPPQLLEHVEYWLQPPHWQFTKYDVKIKYCVITQTKRNLLGQFCVLQIFWKPSICNIKTAWKLIFS